jgi:hypothetical protein
VPATPAVTPGTAGAPRQVNVILRDYVFIPGIVDLVPGETITLNVVNGGLDVHELVLGPQAVQDAWEAAEEVAANPPPGPTPAVSVPPEVAGLRVVVGSGDNPCSLAGLGLIGAPGRHAVSLGTSDTYFGYLTGLPEAVRSEGHLFGAADGGAMFLVCFKNGSLARERIKNDFGLTWEEFSRILTETPPGNRGRIMLPYVLPEITPPVLTAGVRRYGGLAAEDAAGNVRAVAEAQAMTLYLHSTWAGRRPERILVTAGGSENPGLLQVLADVFGIEAQAYDVTQSAALGAALRAAHAWLNGHGMSVGWGALFGSVVTPGSGRIIRPAAAAEARFHAPGGLIAAYAACERHALGRGPDPGEALRAFRAAFPDG